jgi:ATP-binding cassette subfamily F protein uup
MQNPNFLILDEPTNDLDILTLNVLEDYLATFKGCVICVTHDRYFLDKIVDHLFIFHGNGKIKDFPGNYTQFKESIDRQQRMEKILPKTQVIRKDKSREKDPAKLSYKETVELKTLEQNIEALETEKTEIESSLQSGSLPPEELHKKSDRFAVLLKEIESKTDRWIMLCERS